MRPTRPPMRTGPMQVVVRAAGLGLGLSLAVQVVTGVQASREAMRTQLLGLAQIAAAHSSLALRTDDARTATAALAALQARPEITQATLRRADGRLFALYAAAPGTRPVAPGGASDGGVWDGWMRVTQAVRQDGAPPGTLTLEADLSTMWQQLLAGLAWAVVASALAFGAALALAARLLRRAEVPAPTPAPAADAEAARWPGVAGPATGIDTAATASTTPAAPTAPTAPAAPPVPRAAQVLLVEDHALNREVASALLHNLGCRVSLAHDGAQALDAVQRTRFDLLLMDCQMPVMDGYEATRRIRAWEAARPGQPRLPIVAFTAHALAGDREACLAAGMDDHLVKPVVGARLAEVLARHLPPAVAPAGGATTGPPVFDPAVLAALPMVVDGSQPGLPADLRQLFEASSARALAAIEAALAEGQADALRRQLHGLRTSSAQVGALALAALAGDFDHRLRAGEPAAPDWADALRAARLRAVQAWPRATGGAAAP